MTAGTSTKTNTIDHEETGQFMAFLESEELYLWTIIQTNGIVIAIKPKIAIRAENGKIRSRRFHNTSEAIRIARKPPAGITATNG